MKHLRLGICGFGAIGRLVLKLAVERGHEVVSVVDIDEKVVGKDAGEVAGIGRLGVNVSSSLAGLENADVVVHATGSYLDRVFDQVVSIIERGVNVVSTSETLAYPYYRYPVLAKKLDELARMYGVVVIGTGINPGFLLDTLVVTLSSVVTSVKRIRAVRSLDAAKRREPFRKKIGLGEDPELVRQKLLKGEITGHVGYAESVYLIAYAGDLELTRVEERQSPVPAEETIESAGIRVERGFNKGITGYGVGYIKDREVIRLEFHAYAGAPEYEEIVIEGKDYTTTWRSTGTPGDLGTVTVVLNVAEKAPYLPPGLRLMTELLPFKIRFSV
ncbi:MAG: dihydrodipicolinate reductase [Desulfurococcaceae archaeon]